MSRVTRAIARTCPKISDIHARAEPMIGVLREFGPIDALLRWTNAKMTRNAPEKDRVLDFVHENGHCLEWLLRGSMAGLIWWQYRARDYKMPPD
jgi:hypothetical protein